MTKRPLAAASLSCALIGALLGQSCLRWSELETGACGDGFVGREEACDDGNRISGDGCSDDCRIEPPYCGDGRVDAGEVCDDANTLDGDACIEGCREASCGDARLWELREACDDGNDTAGDGCSIDCQLEPMVAGPRCGDGQLDTDEVCDDGNQSNLDACPNGCSWATCGDGLVRPGVEECDDGNPAKADGCSVGCMRCGAEPGSYFRNGNAHCYTAHMEPLTQPQARVACQAEGGDLWTTTSETEARDVPRELGLSGRYWLGLNTSETGRSWVTGENSKYTDFAAGEPSAVANRCVANEVTEGDSAWLSQSCDSALPYVCERAPAFVFPDNHHAFRLFTRPLDIVGARERCEAEGGYLAILDTEPERLFVAKNVALAAWLDASDEGSDGQFVWANGQPVDDSAFAAGQPDDSDDSQACLFLNAGDRIADGSCSDPHAFICELE